MLRPLPSSATCINNLPANEKQRYVMTSSLRQYIAGYTVAILQDILSQNFRCDPMGCRVTFASALECMFVLYQAFHCGLVALYCCESNI